jgi:hypothetical protein
MPSFFTVRQLIALITEKPSPPWRLSDVAKAYQISTLSVRSVFSNVEGERRFTSFVLGKGNYSFSLNRGAVATIKWKIQVIGLSATAPFQAWLLAWQDYDQNGTWHPGILLPGQTPQSSYSQLAADRSGGLLEVVGLGWDGFAYHVAEQRQGGDWFPGGTEPISDQTVKFSQLLTGMGNDLFLQVIGLGMDGLAYLASWFELDKRNWHTGIQLPEPGPRFSALITTYAPVTQDLQVIGLGQSDGLAYQVASQDKTGMWHGPDASLGPGGRLPGQTKPLSQLSSLDGSTGLYVIGLGREDGIACLAGWQDFNGSWHSGGPLPALQTNCSKLYCPGAQIGPVGAYSFIVGLGAADGLAYLVAYQDDSGDWHSGGILPCQRWFAELVVDRNSVGDVQVIGRDVSGLAYLAASSNANIWQSGGPLPNAT